MNLLKWIKKPSPPQVVTFGCRLNAYESEVMKSHAKTQGLEDTIIFNTCAVTNEAERQGRQAIRKLKRKHPNAKIIVTGCSAQINPDQYAHMPEVDRIFGNIEKMRLETFVPENTQKIHVTDIMEAQETSHHLISGFESRVRAFIQIQNGCNHRCTFCSIPFGRGNNRSVPIGALVEQVQTLIKNGCQEVVFTGVDITDYGQDLPGTPTLGQMTKRVLAQVPTLPRLRLSSIDPAELDEDVFGLIEQEERLMPHFHISLQAGDDLTLKRMKRRHLRHHVIEFCQRVRKLRPDVIFGADIIAGFPTETEEMFQNTLQLVDECGLTYLHVFPYSAREGTPAARMPQVPSKAIKERAARLREKGEQTLQTFLDRQIGQVVSVLVEHNNKGHSQYFTPVQIDTKQSLEPGTILDVQITSRIDRGLKGRIHTS